MREAMPYVLSLPVSTVIGGCDDLTQLEENVKIAREFTPLSQAQMAAIACAVSSGALAKRQLSTVVSSARKRSSVDRYVATEHMHRLFRRAVESVKRHATASEHPAEMDGPRTRSTGVADGEGLEPCAQPGVLTDVRFARVDAHVVDRDSQMYLHGLPSPDTSADSGADPGSHDLAVSDGRRLWRLWRHDLATWLAQHLRAAGREPAQDTGENAYVTTHRACSTVRAASRGLQTVRFRVER